MTKKKKGPTTQSGNNGNTHVETKGWCDYRGEKKGPIDDYGRVAPPFKGRLAQVS